MKKSIRAAGVAAMLFVAAPLTPTVHAAQIDIDVDITLPSMLILYCYNKVSVTVDAANLATAIGATGVTGADNAVATTAAQTPTATGSTGSLTANLTAISSTLNVSSIGLQLNNLCAVRAITGASGGVTITPTIENTAQLVAGTGAAGTIGLGTPTATTPTSVSLGTPSNINVTMPLDLSNVQQAGQFVMGGTTATRLRIVAATP